MQIKSSAYLPGLAAMVATLAMALLSGCSSSGTLATGTATPTAAKTIYVTQQQPSSGTTYYPGQILAFSATASGAVTPTGTLTLPAGFLAVAVATDSTGQIYVSTFQQPETNSSTGEILVYAAGATGTATPVRTILPSVSGSAGPLTIAYSLAVDASGNLYAGMYSFATGTTGSAIAVFSSTANGAATPTRVISGSSTGLAAAIPLTLAVDASGNIYTDPLLTSSGSSSGEVLVFSSTATGNVAPIRTITGSSTGLTGTISYHIGVDASGNVYVPAVTTSSPSSTSILIFSSSANGNVAPTRTITGSATTLYEAPSVAVDGVGNIYTINIPSGSTITYNIDVFSPTANGNVAPTSTFTSTAYISPEIYSIAVY